LEKISNSKYKRAIFAVHEKFNKPYLPVSQQTKLPSVLSAFYNEDKVNSVHEGLVECTKSIMQSYQMIDDEICNLEKATRLQSKNVSYGAFTELEELQPAISN